MNRFYATLALGLVGAALTSCAVHSDSTPQQETTIVVTATKTPTPLPQVSSSVTVITAKQLAATGQPYVADALRQVPGLYVNTSGGPGSLTSVAIRGGSPGDTLVLIDGVPVNDPTTPDRSYDWSTMTVDNIDRIEVLRGAQSTLYGSNATAGVIDIITKRGHGTPTTKITLDGGSYGTDEGRLESSGALGSWGYSASASQYHTDGFPLAALQPGDNRDDGFRDSTLSARLDKQLSDAVSLDFTGRYNRSTLQIAGSNAQYLAEDDGLNQTDSEQITLRGQINWQPVSSPWNSTAGISVNTLNRDSLDLASDPNDPNPYGASNYNGRTYKVDGQSSYKANSVNLLTVGVESEQDRAQSFAPGNSPANAALTYYAEAPTIENPRSITTGSGYAQDQLTLASNWFATLGIRDDDHQTFGNRATYRAATDYHFAKGTTLKTNYATGFKAPSLYDLYDPTYGNTKLKPETSNTFDVGIEQSLLKNKSAVSATYFNDKYLDLFSFNPITYQAINIGAATTTGVELAASYRVAKTLDFTLNYTYTRSHNDTTGKALELCPGQLYSASLQYQASPRLALDLTGQYVGQRYDYGGLNSSYEPIVTTLPNYTLINLAAKYDVTNRYKLFARIENLTNADYQEVYSYRTASRAIYGGVTATL